MNRSISPQKQLVSRILLSVVVANTLAFMILALLGTLNVQGKALVFVDFWGRLTVYSLWFIGFLGYTNLIRPRPLWRKIVVSLVAANIPLFLGLAYFDKITSTPETLVFVDFWGRITVYSVWFLAYESYRSYMGEEK